MDDLNSQKGASIIGDYRYLLWRNWDLSRPRLLWVMLNPSTADEAQDDQTLQRCISFSKREAYGGLEVVNLFAYRTPLPRKLLELLRQGSGPDPIGGENMRYVEEAAHRAAQRTGKVVVAWGAMGRHAIVKPQVDAVLGLLREVTGIQVYCLGKTRTGCPNHPCRLPTDTCMVSYD